MAKKSADAKEKHPSYLRLMKVAFEVKGLDGPSEVAKFWELVAQNVTNWGTRGVPKEFAIRAQEDFGCDVNWLLHGTGSEIPEVESAYAKPNGTVGKKTTFIGTTDKIKALGFDTSRFDVLEQAAGADELTRLQLRPLFDLLMINPAQKDEIKQRIAELLTRNALHIPKESNEDVFKKRPGQESTDAVKLPTSED